MVPSLLFRKKKAAATAATMHASKRSPTINSEPLGLKTVADGSLCSSTCPPNFVDRNVVASRSVPQSASADWDIKQKDEVEVEAEEAEEEENLCWASYGRGQGRKFPPAIPLLARTANLSGHMPWVLKRFHKADGSLVIQEVKVKHHEYFRARRENGRLTLQLVELDENSPLFKSGRETEEATQKEKEMTAVVHSRKLSCSIISTSSPMPAGSSYLSCRGEKVEPTDSKICEVREEDTHDKWPPKFVVSSMMSLSSSMPEPAFPAGMRKGCCSPSRGPRALYTKCQ